MYKRIMEVGDGNELLEATPQGVIIRWTWNERMKRYIPITEDTDSAYAQRVAPVEIVPLTPNVPASNGVVALPEDDYFGAGR